ncbi:MAG: AI-2E family transporter [Betaproteobacteria bacterium]|nr:AI-2E family transporter [Betaproteobacteria bacterium]
MPPPSTQAARRAALGVLLVLLLGLGYLVLRPFLASMAWATILGFSSWPLYERLRLRLPRHPNTSALLMTLALALAFMLPVLWLGVLLRNEIARALVELGARMAAGPLQLPESLARLPLIGGVLQDLLRDATREQVTAQLRASAWSTQAAEQAVALLGGAGRNAAKFGFALLTLFFVYRDGERGLRQARAVFRHLLGDRVDAYLQAAGDMTRAVLWGLLVTALAQGVFAGIGYWWAGLPAPVLLAALTALFALAPFGTPVVWVPAALWLLVQGHPGAGFGLLLWGLLVVSWVDNLLRPMVISGSTRVPFVLVVFGVLGGLAAFGLVGLFLGPVVLAVLLAVWREWLEESRLDEAPGVADVADVREPSDVPAARPRDIGPS